MVWTDGIIGGGKQDFATYGETVSDYMVGYLNLEVKTGNMKLVKTSEDGQVAGISFTITGEDTAPPRPPMRRARSTSPTSIPAFIP